MRPESVSLSWFRLDSNLISRYIHTWMLYLIILFPFSSILHPCRNGEEIGDLFLCITVYYCSWFCPPRDRMNWDGKEVPRMDLTPCVILPCLPFLNVISTLWSFSFFTYGTCFLHSQCFLLSSVGRGGLQFFQPRAEGVVSSLEAASGWWAVGQAPKAAHFSPQAECFPLLFTDRPDCVDGRLSFIFYSHLKNMKEIYVTSPVDRKGQAVKGQVNNQLHWLLVSSFIIAFPILLITISEHWAWLFSYPLSLVLHFTD